MHDLPGLLSVMKTESERYAAQNGREFKISEELCDFLGVSILMGINKLPTIKELLVSKRGFRKFSDSNSNGKRTVLRNTGKYSFC